MNKQNLQNKRVAVLVADGFEQIEFTSPVQALKDAGAEVVVVAPEQTQKQNKVRGWNHTEWGDDFDVDINVEDASPDAYNALLLPGGVLNPDTLRGNGAATDFVRGFFKQHKPVAAICHGPQVLINAGVVDGRTVTSFHTIKQDLINAGAEWVDEKVVCDQALVTSRCPDDLDAFNRKMLEEIAEGKHEKQVA